MYTVILKKNEEKRAMTHPWVYANEVAKIEGKDKQGSIAAVRSNDGRLIGYGFINHLSKILVRIFARKESDFDRDFFAARIAEADDFRRSLGYAEAYRVVFGESDNLPGLIVDKYGDYLSVQFLCLGMDVRRDMIVDILRERFEPKGIYERSDVAVRQKEGLEEKKGLLYGDVPDLVPIRENGSTLFVDIVNGQKTGYFLDQQENRLNLARYVKGKRVLDCFCNAGGFSISAAHGGARQVTAVDISRTALDLVEKSAEFNGYNTIQTVQADVFEWLRLARKEGQKFDVIVLDPPAFTKSKDTVKSGMVGYKDINICALKLLEKGGILVTCSCSQHLTLTLFMRMIEESVRESGVRCRMLELRTQGRDHAPDVTDEDTLYLKVAVLRAD
jgi:23S rRNA (cytosine1962-C5)-methyltransferase